MYLAVPVLLYASERLIRAFRPGAKAVKILKVFLRSVYNSVLVIYRQKSMIDFTFLFILIFRWQYIQEMYFHFTCRNLKGSSTQVGSTYMLTVPTSHHYNGILGNTKHV